MWTRRSIIEFGFLTVGGAPARSDRASSMKIAEVVYHLDDLDKVSLVLGNIHNHFAGTNDQVTIALVVYGSALRAFRETSASLEIRVMFEDLVEDSGLKAFACSNSLRAEGIGLKDLVPGFYLAEKGGVVKLAELQGDGYAYIRP